VAIIGKAYGWSEAPHVGETWGVNDLCLRRPVSLVFDIHDLENNVCPESAATVKWVNENNVPIVAQKEYDHIPTSIRFPLEKMHIQYFECTFAYMIAYAVYRGVDEIDIYGVQMDAMEEYYEQRKSTEYWIGYARGKGITVTIHEPTGICKAIHGLYGYETN